MDGLFRVQGGRIRKVYKLFGLIPVWSADVTDEVYHETSRLQAQRELDRTFNKLGSMLNPPKKHPENFGDGEAL